MKAITRRKFMGIVVGGLVGTIFVSKSLIGEVKIKQEIIGEGDIHLIKASEIVSDGLKASNIKVETISQIEYNVVDDLVEEEEVSDILFSTVKNGKITFTALAQWHHFVYHRVGNMEKVYIDGEVDEIMTVFDISSSLENCEIKNYHRSQVGTLIEEEFWFRNKDNA